MWGQKAEAWSCLILNVFKVVALPNYPQDAELALNKLMAQGYVPQTIEYNKFNECFWVFAARPLTAEEARGISQPKDLE